jgi:hypothetical protein
LLDERGHENSFISLIFLDLHQLSLQKLHTIEFSFRNVKIVVNKADLTTFILTHNIDDDDELYWRIGKIVDNAIIVEDMIKIDFTPEYFYDKCAYLTKWHNERGEYIKVRVLNIFS